MAWMGVVWHHGPVAGCCGGGCDVFMWKGTEAEEKDGSMGHKRMEEWKMLEWGEGRVRVMGCECGDGWGNDKVLVVDGGKSRNEVRMGWQWDGVGMNKCRVLVGEQEPLLQDGVLEG